MPSVSTTYEFASVHRNMGYLSLDGCSTHIQSSCASLPSKKRACRSPTSRTRSLVPLDERGMYYTAIPEEPGIWDEGNKQEDREALAAFNASLADPALAYSHEPSSSRAPSAPSSSSFPDSGFTMPATPRIGLQELPASPSLRSFSSLPSNPFNPSEAELDFGSEDTFTNGWLSPPSPPPNASCINEGESSFVNALGLYLPPPEHLSPRAPKNSAPQQSYAPPSSSRVQQRQGQSGSVGPPYIFTW